MALHPPAQMDTFLQLARGPVWDGNLAGKEERDRLVEAGLASRVDGFNVITVEGARIAIALGILRV